MRLSLRLAICCGLLLVGCERSKTPGSKGDEDETSDRDAPEKERVDGSSQGSVRDAATRDSRAPRRSDAGPPAEACGRAELTTQRVVPRVWLLIDGSGSMGGALDGRTGASRYAVLRSALLTPATGLVAELESAVAFGLMIYDGGMSPPGVYVPGVCPRVIVVEPALDNYQAINAAYPQQPTGASTPTHYALLDLQKRIQAAVSPDPSYVLLATDGKPNLCDFHDGIPASAATENEAVVTVAQLAEAGTKTFALSLAGGDRDLQTHLEAVAAAGGTGQGVFSPGSQDDLVDALTQIFGGTQSCDVKVEGTIVEGKECSGEVKLNERTLACDDPDGYGIKGDKQTLELRGAACATLRREPTSTLTASFACDDIVLL